MSIKLQARSQQIWLANTEPLATWRHETFSTGLFYDSRVIERLTGHKHSPRRTKQHTKKKKKKEEKTTFPAALFRATRGIFKRTLSNIDFRQNFSQMKFRP